MKNISDKDIIKASITKDVKEFMYIVFPEEWNPIIARIIESGVTFYDGMCKWAPRWSPIPFTIKKGKNDLHGALKSVIYRTHDCLHQLWGLPIPTSEFSENEYFKFIRAGMCGEIAVLTLTEFIFCRHLYDSTSEEVNEMIKLRNAIKMLQGPLNGKTAYQIAMRLDDILHKGSVPKWVRDDEASQAFLNDYYPMMEQDRVGLRNNWHAMKLNNWLPIDAPNTRYADNLDGLELTLWLIKDFYHLMNTDEHIDYALADFNRLRRNKIILPEEWV